MHHIRDLIGDKSKSEQNKITENSDSKKKPHISKTELRSGKE